ncbi:hypothetical protein [Paenibacillus odorifer]|uniref:hypothetical protein n=1 Tax=Paenibacillus odorifer TaxID=189426 RepID=UPI001E518370|nr:hypothetical protein [Paenibacillus odorifer]
MQIGRKIFYELTTGYVVQDIGERSGDVIETTIDQDFAAYRALSERVPETVGILQLEYEEYKQDFAECNGYRVNVNTKKLEFSYPDPNTEPEYPQEPVYQEPLTERLKNLELESAGIGFELATTQSRLDQAEQEQANLLLRLVEGGVL